MKAKFIEVTSFDREVDDSASHMLLAFDDIRTNQYNVVSALSMAQQEVTFKQKMYHRIRLTEDDQQYDYYINFDDIRFSVPILTAEIEQLEYKYKSELRNKDIALNSMRKRLVDLSNTINKFNNMTLWQYIRIMLKRVFSINDGENNHNSKEQSNMNST